MALLISVQLFAQQSNLVVTGTVTDDQNEVVVGASVVVKGTTNGTTTDSDGRYSISLPTGNETLVISFIGYASQEVAVNNRTQIDVSLITDIATLNEVVVIGYQTVKKKDLTGATGVVEMSDARKITSQSVAESLQGLIPGVSVRNGGAPGSGAAIEIRGVSNFGSTAPLYVIDGMMADANVTINPADIATIQVLKDASAAAIYGSRAGNGVVIITTKKGEDGPAKISFSARSSIQQLPKTWDVMDAPKYLETVSQQYQNSAVVLPTGIADQIANNTINTDWQDEIFRTGQVHDYNFGISQGSKNGSMFVSLGYYKNKGVLIANDFDRASLRVNSETKKGRFTFGENIMLSNSRGNHPGGGVNAFYESATSLPIIGVRGPQYAGIPFNPGSWGMGTSDVPSYSSNYIANSELNKVKYNYAKLVGNAYAQLNIIEGLNYRFNAGAETSFDYFKDVRYEGIWRYANQMPHTSVNETRQVFTNFLLEHTLNYNRVFGKHDIAAVVGFVRTEQKRQTTSGGRLDLAEANGQIFTTINSATGEPSASGGTPMFWRAHGYLGRVNYNYDERFMLTLTGRIDQDSRFGSNYRTGYFPSVAAAWRISNEKFFNVSQISDLKLRASYGKLGFSDVLNSWDYVSLVNTFPRAVLGTNQIPAQGAYQSLITNSDIHWETRTQKNIGVDASLFNDRLSISMDWYKSVSEDVLVFLPIASYLGGSGSPAVNAASISNSGIEFSATYRSKPSSSDFKWDITGNFTTIKNEVLEVGNRGKDASGNRVDYIEPFNFIRAQVGHSIGQWYVIKSDGIFRSDDEIKAHVNSEGIMIQPNAKPGDVRYVDADDDGQINDDDRQYAGSPWPKLQVGGQFNVSYKQFSLNLQLVGVFGNKNYNDVRRVLDSYELANFRNDIDPWSEQNPNGSDPRLAVNQGSDPTVSTNNLAQSDRWLESGSYLRVRNIELGYAVPKSILSKINFSNVRVFISGQNLLTFTKYKGLDPDVQGNSIIARGFDTGNWPASRVVSLGIQADF
ncbi:SusC/RagA family TonB-linked outer membrane protein [Pseudochryseolinea flava]|uniref:SusC/RagA family TonB-linked outer membrane protein n=2 Tax=Pseudochryseolinea flava TaxID=2059302 RepID=A0A364XX20_9BACT|nr:SusC/RagA family TonB-linked outer membrane protein [Pseudochryseolinea flava]